METNFENFKRDGLKIKFFNHYDDYKTFMELTKDPIYRTILSAFEELKEKDVVSINVIANVHNTEFESIVEFTKLNLDVLTDVIIPYFEEVEDYETCAKVIKVLNDINPSKVFS